MRVRFVNNVGRKLKTFYPGKINQINNDDNDDNETTFDIVYDDGDTRNNAPLNDIQIKYVSAVILSFCELILCCSSVVFFVSFHI